VGVGVAVGAGTGVAVCPGTGVVVGVVVRNGVAVASRRVRVGVGKFPGVELELPDVPSGVGDGPASVAVAFSAVAVGPPAVAVAPPAVVVAAAVGLTTGVGVRTGDGPAELTTLAV
jgi:hypothetical protein